MTISQIGRAVILAVGVWVVAACEDATVPGGGVAGTYELVAAQGEDLPAVVFEGETEAGQLVATAISGTLTLRGSTYTERVAFRVELDGQSLGEQPLVLHGTYTVDGQFLEFEPDGGEPFTGTLVGGVLTTVEQDPDFGELELSWSQ